MADAEEDSKPFHPVAVTIPKDLRIMGSKGVSEVVMSWAKRNEQYKDLLWDVEFWFPKNKGLESSSATKMTTERKRALENSMDQMLAVRSLWRPRRHKGALEIMLSFIKRHQHIEGIDEIFNLKSLVGDPDDDCSNDPVPPARSGPYLLLELYKVVVDPSTDSTVSWSPSGNSVIIWNESEFCKEHLLPRCSKFKDMSHFTGWLVSMGFRKVESSAPWEYSCEYFVRGKPLFLPNRWLTETPSSGLEPVPDYVSNFERNVETNLKRILARRVPGYLASR